MATYRIGISSEFSLDAGVGIGTSTPKSGLGDLRVDGTTKTEDLDITGVSTFIRYAGFAVDSIEIGKDSRDTSLTGEHSTQGDIVVGVNSTFTVSTGATITVGTVPSVSIGTHFSPPTGGVEDRPEVPVEGTVRFNTDLNTLEFYNGVEWRQFIVNSASDRGVIHLGYNGSSDLTTIDFVNISSQGAPQNFGDLSQDRRLEGAASSEIKGLFGGGQSSSTERDTIDYITLQSGGTATDFGNLGSTRTIHQAFSSSTRAVWGGSYNSPGFSNVMEYVEISTTGNAADFGDAVNSGYSSMAVSSPTRGILAGGYTSTMLSSIDFFTIASKGNGTNFGELTSARRGGGRASNSVRGIFAGGAKNPGPVYISSIDYITIASAGNAVPFGDLTYSSTLYSGGTSSQTRGVFMGGYPENKNIDAIEIATTGSTFSFGELSVAVYGPVAVSDCHGGLGGY